MVHLTEMCPFSDFEWACRQTTCPLYCRDAEACSFTAIAIALKQIAASLADGTAIIFTEPQRMSLQHEKQRAT